MTTKNLILMTDSYKFSHFMQYPKDITRVNSYIEPRRSNISASDVVNFGLQMFMYKYLTKPISQDDIDEAEEICQLHGEPFNKEGWQYILDKHFGYLPIVIEALPEGMVFPVRNVQVQIRNTDPKVPWLTSFLETALLRAVWYPSTVATLSREAKKIINKYLQETCDIPNEVLPWRLHDFGARGCTSSEQAGIGGVAHLVNFMGTDTVEGLVNARRYYSEKMAGFSIPAAEHSTIMAWETESDAYKNMVVSYSGDGKLYAVVSDTYNVYNAVDKIWGDELKDLVIKNKGTLVIRPDSGDPLTVTKYIIDSLGQSYGFTVNSKGYRVLNPSVRIIQGDGVDLRVISDILDNYKKNGWSAENIAFGMGAGLLQKVNRDTLSYAMKASAVERNGKWVGIAKTPITDKSKSSKKGVLGFYNDPYFDGYATLDVEVAEQEAKAANKNLENLLVPVYNNGDLLKTWNLTEIRNRASI